MRPQMRSQADSPVQAPAAVVRRDLPLLDAGSADPNQSIMSDSAPLSEESAQDGGSLPIHALRFEQFRTFREIGFIANGRLTVVCGPNNSGNQILR